MRRLRSYFGIFALVCASVAPSAAQTMALEEISIPMDDGVKLYGWVRHAEPARKRPVILMDTVYGQPLGDDTGTGVFALQEEWGADDFALVVLHIRGNGASEGLFDLYGSRTKQDAWQIAEWISKQDWCDGSILAYGNSGNGLAAWDLAVSDHPAIKAVLPVTVTIDHYRDVFFEGGGGPGWTQPARFAQPRAILDPGNLEARGRVGHRTDIIPEQLTVYESVIAEAHARELDGEWWRERSTWEELPAATVPILGTSSFYEIVSWSPYTNVLPRMQNMWAIMFRGHDGPPVLFEAYGRDLMRRFVRHFLLGEANGFDAEPRFQFPVNLGSPMMHSLGHTLVRKAATWPLPGTEWTRMWLRAGRTGSAVSLNDGALSLEPVDSEPADVLPVSTGGYPLGELRLHHWQISNNLSKSWPLPPEEFSDGDLRPSEVAALTYTTEPFVENVEITGPVTLRVHARSTAPDFTWVVRIADVWPDGRSMWIGDLRLRASLARVDEDASIRNGDGDIVIPWYPFSAYETIFPADVKEYLIHAGDVANVFRAGHRLRIDLIGVGHGQPNAPLAPGAIEVFHDAARPSSVLLPVIPSLCQSTPVAFPHVTHPGDCAASLAAALGSPE